MQQAHEPEGNPTAAVKPSLLGMMTSPTLQFQRIAERPDFWSAFLTILGLTALTTAVMLTPASPPGFVITMSVLGVLLGAPISLLISALLQWIFLRVLSGKATYRQVFSLNVYTSVISLLGLILQAIIVVATGANIQELQNSVTPTSLAAFISSDSLMVKALLGNIEIFAIWHLILTALGLSIIGKVSTAKGWTVALTLFILGVALATGLGAVGDTFKDFVPPQ
ncbi:Yip1 domain-containing protein [Marininema mesophilum]|uniref:Yip1 domain-containing protein n=1 Tax=Marininema mesophilum TaxID=1048340 RepID=A0A1H2Z1Q7_9BACL|nr:Yip1 family protein [Marininema mesophilum]SDX11372.1 Yip1 domain-containing protein [Marininema mesophilum]